MSSPATRLAAEESGRHSTLSERTRVMVPLWPFVSGALGAVGVLVAAGFWAGAQLTSMTEKISALERTVAAGASNAATKSDLERLKYEMNKEVSQTIQLRLKRMIVRCPTPRYARQVSVDCEAIFLSE